MPFALVAVLIACGSPDRVIVAVGTTLEDSGILSELVAEYEAARPVQISVIGESTQRVLDLGRRGAAEVLITHAPAAEEAFVAAGAASSREPFAASRFVLVGPPARIAALADMTPEAAFAHIAAAQWAFVTRADGSGTEAAERSIWAAVGITPGGSWYQATGLGMGDTLQVADQREALTLAEEGTFVSVSGALTIVAAELLDSDLLMNPYHVMVVAGASTEARAFADWLVSPEGRQALRRANDSIFGEQVFAPTS